MKQLNQKLFSKIISLIILLPFLAGQILTPPIVQAQVLPVVELRIGLTSSFQPPILRGMTVHPENPLLFDFIVDRGQDKIADDLLKDESTKLIKYFLTSMTIPDKDAWVNLSPYEKDRIIPDALGQTEMGRQMLEQDYVLKQLAASLTNPDTELGKRYWDEVHRLETLDVRRLTLEKTTSVQPPASNDFNKVWIVPDGATVVEKDGFAYITESKLTVMLDEDRSLDGQRSVEIDAGAPSTAVGTLDARRLTLGKNTATNVQPPASNDFNKVWIVPDGATVVEKDGFAYITESKLTVMLDEDYGSQNLSSPHALSGDPLHKIDSRFRGNDIEKLSTQVFRELILPKLIEEVNTGKNFAATRQVYQSVILAAWYKRALKDSLLGKIYADKSKIEGVETDVKDIKQKVYEQYLEAFKQGAYNVIKEEDGPDGELIPRKYFSGGEIMAASSGLNVVKDGRSLNEVRDEINSGEEKGRIALVAASTVETPAESDAIVASAAVRETDAPIDPARRSFLRKLGALTATTFLFPHGTDAAVLSINPDTQIFASIENNDTFVKIITKILPEEIIKEVSPDKWKKILKIAFEKLKQENPNVHLQGIDVPITPGTKLLLNDISFYLPFAVYMALSDVVAQHTVELFGQNIPIYYVQPKTKIPYALAANAFKKYGIIVNIDHVKTEIVNNKRAWLGSRLNKDKPAHYLTELFEKKSEKEVVQFVVVNALTHELGHIVMFEDISLPIQSVEFWITELLKRMHGTIARQEVWAYLIQIAYSQMPRIIMNVLEFYNNDDYINNVRLLNNAAGPTVIASRIIIWSILDQLEFGKYLKDEEIKMEHPYDKAISSPEKLFYYSWREDAWLSKKNSFVVEALTESMNEFLATKTTQEINDAAVKVFERLSGRNIPQIPTDIQVPEKVFEVLLGASSSSVENPSVAASAARSSSSVEETLDILKKTGNTHRDLPLVASVIGSLGNIAAEKSINYVFQNEAGNQFGLLPIKLDAHGLAFLRTFLPDSIILADASVLIFKAGQGNYRGAFDKTGPLAVGIVFFDQRKNQKCLFEFSQLWNNALLNPEWILGNAKEIPYPNWKSGNADWFAFKISDEDAMISPANGRLLDSGYFLKLLTITPFTLMEEKRILGPVNDLERFPIAEIFSVNDPASIDMQTAVFENKTILEGKTVHVTGPGAGIDAVMALKYGAREVSFYDTNPAQQLLTFWNLNFARQTGKIPTESKFFPVDGMVDADVYIFNTPAVNTKENIINNVKNQTGYYETVASRSYFMDAKEFEVIFNQLKDKLQNNKNAVAIWRLLISDDAGFLPEGKSYLERVQNFLKQHGLTGEPILVNATNVREAGDAHPNLFMIRALNPSAASILVDKQSPLNGLDPQVGGIDFDPSKLNLQIKRDGRGVPLPLPQQDLENINIKGLYPVIINILPVNAQALPILGQIEPAPSSEISKG